MKWVQRKAKRKPNKSDSAVEQIAKIRGIENPEEFLSPSEEVLHDPYLMRNIEKASNRIIRAINSNERIVVSYDPDADGITSATIMLRYLKNYTDNTDFIYGERGDGHGIYEMIKVTELNEEKHAERIARNIENTDKIREADLLILIDSSSNDDVACQFVKDELGTEIIILDHHAIENDNPHVLMVNPQHPECGYPNKFLSGAGVVFKTLQVMEDTLGQVDVWQYNDLVAVGMYADIMRVDILENRYLIMNGMRNIKNTGLERICKGASVNTFNGIKGDDIGFSIAPLINGVARMDNIKLAIDILLEDDDAKCKPIRLKMQKLNEARKAKQKEIVDQYLKNVDDTKKVLVVTDEQSSKGFNGIVAQQLSDKYSRPVIVGRIHKGTLSGSFRSFNGFKFKSFLNQFDGEIEALGHEGAGGIVISVDQLDNLYAYIERFMPSLEDVEPTLYYDLEFGVDDVTTYLTTVERYNHLAGAGFPRVVVRVNGITVDEVDCIGKTMETVKISTMDAMGDKYENLSLIKFRVNDQYANDLGTFDEIDAVGQLATNEFFNFGTRVRTFTPQVMIEDYKQN